MKRYTITWLPKVETRLANLWLASANAPALTQRLTRSSDCLLRTRTVTEKAVAKNLFEIEVFPIVVAFGISEPDRLVRVVKVIELGPIDS